MKRGVLSFWIRKALAACVYRSAAFSYFSVFPPKRLKPLDALDSALSAWGEVSYRSVSKVGWVKRGLTF